MKILLIVLLSFALSNSSEEPQLFEYHLIGQYVPENKDGKFSWGSTGRMTVGKLFVDGCMYITIAGHYDSSTTHAGNCPNQIHKR